MEQYSRDTIEDFGTIDLGPEHDLDFEPHVTELDTIEEAALDPAEFDPTLQNAVHGTIDVRRLSEPAIHTSARRLRR